MSPTRHNLIFALILGTVTPWVMAASQPTDIHAFHRGGQTFITWSEQTDLYDETYRIYVHTAPISAVSIDAAELIAATDAIQADQEPGDHK